LAVWLKQRVLAWREIGIVLKDFGEVLGCYLWQVLVKGLVFEEVLPEMCQLLIDGSLADGT
jgi:hypothetical protein